VLYLFSPAGVRYSLHRWRKTKNPPFLRDWSGDKTRVLLATLSGTLEQMVLATGKVSLIHLPKKADLDGYTRPSGQGLFAWQLAGNRFQLARYDLDGKLAKVLTPDADDLSGVYSRSGSELAVGAAHGIWLVSNNGGITRRLTVPGARAGCMPARWWTPRTILVSCQATKKSRSRLWLVPAGGGKPQSLTAQRGKTSVDPGDIDAWPLHGNLYLQVRTRLGQEEIFRQSPGGALTAVPVPHVPRSAGIAATLGSRLLIGATDICTNHSSLLWLDPATGHEQLLINTKPRLAGVLGAVAYGQPIAEFHQGFTCGFARAVRS
jgi:hypothetical protein